MTSWTRKTRKAAVVRIQPPQPAPRPKPFYCGMTTLVGRANQEGKS